MKHIAPLALTVLVGSALPVQAGNHDKNREGTPVVLIGEVTSQPKDYGFMHEKKLQVSTGPSMGEHTLHLSDAVLQDYHGRKRGVSDLHDKMWVRAEGRMMKDSRRIKVTRLEIIGNDRTAYHNSIYFTPQTASGTLTTVTSSVAGSRETLSDPMAEAYLGHRTQGPDTDFEAIGPEGILAQLPLDTEAAADESMYYASPDDLLYDDATLDGLQYSSPSPDVAGDTLNQDMSDDVSEEDAYYDALYDEFMSEELMSDELMSDEMVSDTPAPEAVVMPDQEISDSDETYNTSETYNSSESYNSDGIYDPNDEADVHSDEIVDQELLGSQSSSDIEDQNVSDDTYYDALYDEFMYEEMLNDQPREDIVPDGTPSLDSDTSTDETMDPMLEEGC